MNVDIKEYLPIISTELISDNSGLIKTEKHTVDTVSVYDIDCYISGSTFSFYFGRMYAKRLTFNEMDGLFYLMKKIIFPDKENELIDCGWKVRISDDYYVLTHVKACNAYGNPDIILSREDISDLYNEIGYKLNKFESTKIQKEGLLSRIKKMFR